MFIKCSFFEFGFKQFCEKCKHPFKLCLSKAFFEFVFKQLREKCINPCKICLSKALF